ncbi:MAG: type II secretion system protein [Pirellulales bacterium]|nr:type II secretion system protein [Pirellulales bacterium]
MTSRRARNGRRAGFTMIEMMTIIVILGALASVVVPVFQDSSEDAKDATLMYNVKHIRLQIERYRAEHKGNPPGTDGWHPFLHLLFYTNANGEISLSQNSRYPYGPYVTVQGLTNPFNEGIAFLPSNDPASASPNEELEADGAIVGWFYDAATGRIAPNVEGTTSNGTPRVQL